MPHKDSTCDIWGHRFIKNGTTSASWTRWRCAHCGASTTRRRADLGKQATFTHFICWIAGPAWPATRAQRCLVHIPRNVWTCMTTRPKTSAGKALRRLSLELTRIASPEQAASWVVQLQAIGTQFGEWLDEKTYRDQVGPEDIPRSAASNKKWWYTHLRICRACQLMLREYRKHTLFTYLTPPRGILVLSDLASSTKNLEGAISYQVKTLIYARRGISGGHLRIMADWWLNQHTQCPDDPVKIART